MHLRRILIYHVRRTNLIILTRSLTHSLAACADSPPVSLPECSIGLWHPGARRWRVKRQNRHSKSKGAPPSPSLGPLVRLQRADDRKGTPEVRGEINLRKRMLFQSIGLVGAVGIEFESLSHKSRKRNDVAPPPLFNWSLLEPRRAVYLALELDRSWTDNLDSRQPKILLTARHQTAFYFGLE